MKRSTPEHPKLLDLCARMKLRRWEAAGVLELIWHFTAKFAPQGDIGKYSDEAIAKAIDWNRDPERIVNALVEAKWLDRCECHRLTVHDWPEHADQTVARVLAKRKLAFVQHETSTELASGGDSETKTSQPKAYSHKPEPKPLPVTVVSDRFDELWQRWPRKTGRDSAARDWLSVVTAENEAAAMACADRYLSSGEVSEGKVRNLGSTTERTGWLIDCARDNWECDWPPAQRGDRNQARRSEVARGLDMLDQLRRQPNVR
jgi:hypothetical protein